MNMRDVTHQFTMRAETRTTHFTHTLEAGTVRKADYTDYIAPGAVLLGVLLIGTTIYRQWHKKRPNKSDPSCKEIVTLQEKERQEVNPYAAPKHMPPKGISSAHSLPILNTIMACISGSTAIVAATTSTYFAYNNQEPEAIKWGCVSAFNVFAVAVNTAVLITSKTRALNVKNESNLTEEITRDMS